MVTPTSGTRELTPLPRRDKRKTDAALTLGVSLKTVFPWKTMVPKFAIAAPSFPPPNS